MNIINKITSNIIYFTIFEFVILILLFMILYVWKPNFNYIKRILIQHDIDVNDIDFDIYQKYPLVRLLIMLFVIFISILLFFFVKHRNNLEKINVLDERDRNFFTINKFLYKVLFTIFIIVAFIVLIVLFLKGLHKIDWNIFYNYFVTISFILIIIGGIYIFLLPFISDKYSKNKDSIIYKILRYIPIALVTFINLFNEKFNMDNSTTLVILLILFLALLYFILPVIWRWIYMNDGIQLLKKPIYLNNKYNLDDLYSKYFKTTDMSQGLNYGIFHNDIDLIKKRHQHIYTFSFWYYINPQPPNTNASYVKTDGANILNFGNKPVIKYYGKSNLLKIFTRIDNKNLEELKELYVDNNIKYQKWNNMVIVYDGGNVDLFINSKLVASQDNISPLMSYDILEIGENNGIHGGICNIVYYNRKMSMNEILVNYKMFNLKKEPYF